MPVQIEIVSDVVCPWCYIGKRRLEQALAGGGPQVEVVWRPFQLNPDLPETGMERDAYVRRKFGAAGGGLYARVAAVGASAGIPFAFERIVRQPNTVAAHQLIALAVPGPQQDAVVESLFRGYFLEGADLTDRQTLLALAGRAGLDATATRACLDDAASRQAVLDADGMARDLGVEGVPFFIFDRRFAVSGAQEAAVLAQAIERAAEVQADPA
jgi:predicted DsbA family dithiol-disulfide isomerase